MNATASRERPSSMRNGGGPFMRPIGHAPNDSVNRSKGLADAAVSNYTDDEAWDFMEASDLFSPDVFAPFASESHVSTTVSGLSDMLSIFCSRSHCARSG